MVKCNLSTNFFLRKLLRNNCLQIPLTHFGTTFYIFWAAAAKGDSPEIRLVEEGNFGSSPAGIPVGLHQSASHFARRR
jgi:hypothetical protein